MYDTLEARATRRARRATRRARVWPLAALLLLVPRHATARPDASPGLLMRQARYAAAAGNLASARTLLQELRRRDPRSARGFEATLLLADVELGDGNDATADAVLADAERSFATGDAAARLALARGWLAVATRRHDVAEAELAKVPALEPRGLSADLAELGAAWSQLLAESASDATARFARLARSASDPALRVAAAMSLARAEAASGRLNRALHALRSLRRIARGTRLADDVDLALGLAQLDGGNPRAARRTFERLARTAASVAEGDVPAAPSPPSGSSGLSLSDLRETPAAFAHRVAALYTARTDRAEGLMTYLARLFDRDAVADVPEALRMTDASASRKEA